MILRFHLTLSSKMKFVEFKTNEFLATKKIKSEMWLISKRVLLHIAWF